MPEPQGTAPAAPSTPATTPAPTVLVKGKVSLLEMIVFAEVEAERLDIWERQLSSTEAKISVGRRAHIARMTVRTLDLLRDNEKDFIDLVRKKNEVAQRKGKAK